MPRHPSKNLTDLEYAIMRTVWDHAPQPASVEHIQSTLGAAGRPLALPSIRTMLGILMKKGYLDRQQDGRRHLYAATVAEADARSGIVREVVDRAFDGSAVDLVASLVKSDMVDPGDVEKVRAMLDQLVDKPADPSP